MSKQEEDPKVGIIMGSDSDLPVMQESWKVLEEFSIPHEVRIISAHRTPDRMREYGRTALSRGLRVIIAAAGGSAHLQGMSAAETIVPILGVAINKKYKANQAAQNSQTEMPKGVPLAYTGENEEGANKAALFAVRMLAMDNEELQAAYLRYVEKMTQEVEEKDRRLQEIGPDAYLAEMLKEKAK